MRYGYVDGRGRYVRDPTIRPAYSVGSPGPPRKVSFPGHLTRLWGGKLLVLVGVLCATLVVSGTLAYLSVELIPKTNVFSFGDTTVSIDEDFRGWELKHVKLTNVKEPDSVPGVVRAMLVPVLKVRNEETGKFTDGTGSAGQPLVGPSGNHIVIGDFTFELFPDWERYWFYKDRYFYYKEVLAPGETTELLLKKVYLTDNSPENRAKYADIKVEVEVLADIIQAAGGAPHDAWGVTVDADGKVTP